MTLKVGQLLDASNAEAVKRWADRMVAALAELQGGGAGGASGVIKSIQRGPVLITGTNVTGTATVTAVDVTKSELRELGQTNAPGAVGSMAYLVLTNGTTITATRVSSSSGTTTVSWELTEYE